MKRQQRMGLMMTTVGAVIALGAMTLSIGSASATSTRDSNNDGHKVTICHAVSGLGETKHGYNIISVDVASIFSKGHTTHTKEGRHDIIPAFDYYDKHGTLVHFTGLGDASWIANGCVAPETDQSTTVKLCHATDSSEMPYELVTVTLKNHKGDESVAFSSQRLYLDGHEKDDGDIIPPFGTFGGRNWTDEGKAIWTNNCVIPPAKSILVCHVNDSPTAPYALVDVTVQPVVGEATLDIGGHQADTGSLWTDGMKGDWGDIIPPFDYMKDGKLANYAGYNWPAGKAIFDAKCVVTIEPTTTTTTTTTTESTTTTVGQELPLPTTTTAVAQQLPLPEQVADASGALPGTGSSQTMLLVIGALMALGGLIVTFAVRRPHHA